MKLLPEMVLFLTSLVLLALIADTKRVSSFMRMDANGKANANQVRKQCRKTIKPNEELVNDLLDLKFSEDKVLKCYIHCLAVNWGAYSDDKGFNEPVIKSITHEKDNAMALGCTKNITGKGKDHCDITYSYYKCLMINFHAQNL